VGNLLRGAWLEPLSPAAAAGALLALAALVAAATLLLPSAWAGAAARAAIAAEHGATIGRVEAAAPGDQAAAEAAHAIQRAGLEHSLAGRFGRLIEPAVRPLGYDWQIGIGLIGAFAAREVFVSTMGVVYGVGAVDDDTRSLEERMADARRADGTPVWSPLLAVSLMVWFVLAMQCLSTVAVMVRETRSWRWPLIQLAGMNTLAYLAALA
ncbi:MAG: ferrous iron transport protein B, partial [Phycisphaerae bacterium]|nr:ferrous iron transport protein B [Phycisphaerae bacterium]